jgi:hypothetical protein
VLLLLAAAAQGWAAAPPAAASPALSVSASIEPAEIRIGDTARLTVIVRHPAGGELTLPELEQGRAVVVRDRDRRTAGLERGREQTTFRIQLTSYEPGEHRLGGGAVGFAGHAGAPQAAPFPVVALRTRSVLPAGDVPLREIKGPVRWATPIARRTVPVVALLLVAAAVALGARRWLAGRRTAPVPVAAPLSASDAALQALAALRRGIPAEERLVEPFYRDMSAIVRGYAEQRFGLRAPEQTTEEALAEAMRSGRLTAAHQELVRRFLEHCDLVKFARHRPPPGEVTQALAAAERLVRETRQVAGP